MAFPAIPASNNFDELLSHIKRLEESILQENLTFRALMEQEGRSIGSLDKIYASKDESDSLTEQKLDLVHHICTGRRVLSQEYISVIASERFLRCIQLIMDKRLNFDTENEISNYFQKIPSSIQYVSSLKELNDYYSHYLELIECNYLEDTKRLKEQFHHRYILILARGFPDYTRESLINHLKEIKRMDKMKIGVDFSSFRDTAILTAIIHADTSGFIQDLFWVIKELNIENQAIINYIETKYNESIIKESKTMDNEPRNVLPEKSKTIDNEPRNVLPEKSKTIDNQSRNVLPEKSKTIDNQSRNVLPEKSKTIDNQSRNVPPEESKTIDNQSQNVPPEESKTIDNQSQNVLPEESERIYDKSQIMFPAEPYKLYDYGNYLIAKWRVNLRENNIPAYVVEYHSSNKDLIRNLAYEEEKIIRELSELDRIQSFLKYYGFYEAHDPENRNIMEKYSFGIVMEGFDCKLDRDIRKRRVEEYEFNIKEFEEAVRDLVSAVQVMHEHRYSHLSISFDNLVIGYDGHIKIVDFHLAALNKLNRLTPSAFDNVMKKFRAPEIISYMNSEKELSNSKLADVYSLGLVIYKLFMRDERLILNGENNKIILKRNIDEITGQDFLWLHKLLHGMLAYSPYNRCDINTALSYTPASETKPQTAPKIK